MAGGRFRVRWPKGHLSSKGPVVEAGVACPAIRRSPCILRPNIQTGGAVASSDQVIAWAAPATKGTKPACKAADQGHGGLSAAKLRSISRYVGDQHARVVPVTTKPEADADGQRLAVATWLAH